MMGEASIFISYELWNDLDLNRDNLPHILQFPKEWVIRDIIGDPSTRDFEVIVCGEDLAGVMVGAATKEDDCVTWDWKVAGPWRDRYEYPRGRSLQEIAKSINTLFAAKSEGL